MMDDDMDNDNNDDKSLQFYGDGRDYSDNNSNIKNKIGHQQRQQRKEEN